MNIKNRQIWRGCLVWYVKSSDLCPSHFLLRILYFGYNLQHHIWKTGSQGPCRSSSKVFMVWALQQPFLNTTAHENHLLIYRVLPPTSTLEMWFQNVWNANYRSYIWYPLPEESKPVKPKQTVCNLIISEHLWNTESLVNL